MPLRAGNVLDQLRAVGVMLAHVVVVDRLLNEVSGGDSSVDGRCQRLPVNLGDDVPIPLDLRVRPDHLQVEHDPARHHRLEHSTQDVHDVLRLHASERPGEHDEIERFSLDLELLRRRDAVADPSDKFGRERTPRRRH